MNVSGLMFQVKPRGAQGIRYGAQILYFPCAFGSVPCGLFLVSGITFHVSCFHGRFLDWVVLNESASGAIE